MRRALGLDVLVVAWTLAWIAVALTVASEIRGLARLSETVASVGRAAQDTSRALEDLGALPLVGEAVRESSEGIRTAGASAVARARESRRSAVRLSVLLGISIAVIPSVPVLAFYLPQRIAWARRRRAIRQALERRDPVLEEQLAFAAFARLGPRELGDVSLRPIEDLLRGRHRALADSELRRLGLSRPG